MTGYIRRRFMEKTKGLSWAPSWGGIIAVAATFLAGAVLGSVVTLALTRKGVGMDACMLISYPVMFVFTGLLAYLKGRKPGAVLSRLDRSVKPQNWYLFPLVMVLTFAASFVCDIFNMVLPQMPEDIQKALEAATGGNFWLNLVSVAVLAPLLEEWLCRGLILSGLLTNGTRPALAIVVSALFFAIIHGNLWQAVPAFALGALFGYVYYKTGSLKLTILMHFTNNFISLLVSRSDQIGQTDGWMDIMPVECYWVLFAIFALSLIVGVCTLSRLHIVDSENVGPVA